MVMLATRFAPSPTGRLHLGHAYAALIAHDAARAGRGAFRLRIDDIDSGRCRGEFRAAIDADLAWLGLLRDGPPLVQSTRAPRYASALERLRQEGLLYPCFCSRSDIAAAATAPHGPEGLVYPGTCRALEADQRAERMAAGMVPAWRLDLAAATARTGQLDWVEAGAGRVMARPDLLGDVVLGPRDRIAAYHLASTIDDADMAITLVTRGRDLAFATHMHRLLQALLDLPSPEYRHHALIGGAAGVRLAKRDGAAELAALRDAGVDPAALVASLRAGQLPLGYCWVDA